VSRRGLYPVSTGSSDGAGVPADPGPRPDPLGIAADRSALAAILDAQGRHREALVPMREALVLAETLLGRDHYEVALLLRTLGDIAERAGDPGQAAVHYRRALRIQRRLLGVGHPDVAETLTHLRRAVRIGLDQADD
jgi:tetratricopeptide (TPR) repeat protein